MAYNIAIDRDYMNDLARLYSECAAELDGALSALASIGDVFSTEYEGHATELAPDTAAKTREHILLLQQCCEHMAAYVRYSRDTLIKADRTGSMGVSIE